MARLSETYRTIAREYNIVRTAMTDIKQHEIAVVQKCVRCYVMHSLDNFNVRRNNVRNKTCKRCCAVSCAQMARNKCVHGKKNSKCAECGGSSLCVHQLQKYHCRTCDPINVSARGMVNGSIYADKKKSRPISADYITIPFVLELIAHFQTLEMKCHYCPTRMILDTYCEEMATIERLDNSLPHTKANCTLACMACNRGHQGVNR
jgi:DNA-binding protein